MLIWFNTLLLIVAACIVHPNKRTNKTCPERLFSSGLDDGK